MLGLNLLPYVESCQRLLLLDLVDGGAPPGTLFELTGPELLHPGVMRLFERQNGFRELLSLAALRGNLPGKLILLGVQPAGLDFGAPMSLAAVMGMAKAVRRALELLGAWEAA